MSYFLWLLIFIGAFIINLFGLMNLVPKIITLPFLFLVIYLFLYFIFQKNSFRGTK